MEDRRVAKESVERMNDVELNRYAMSQRFAYETLKDSYYLELEEIANVEIMRRRKNDDFYTKGKASETNG